jgi:hypothetical protein
MAWGGLVKKTEVPMSARILGVLMAGLLVSAVCPGAALGAGPLRLEITLEKKEYPFRGAIPLTITYTNISDETVILLANGTCPGEGFPGETFELTSGAGKKTYTIHGIDPAIQKIEIKPGQSWKRTIKELAVELSRPFVTIDGKMLPLTGPLPDPFGRLDDFTIKLRYEPTIGKQAKPAFNDKLESNTVKLSVRW